MLRCLKWRNGNGRSLPALPAVLLAAAMGLAGCEGGSERTGSEGIVFVEGRNEPQDAPYRLVRRFFEENPLSRVQVLVHSSHEPFGHNESLIVGYRSLEVSPEMQRKVAEAVKEGTPRTATQFDGAFPVFWLVSIELCGPHGNLVIGLGEHNFLWGYRNTYAFQSAPLSRCLEELCQKNGLLEGARGRLYRSAFLRTRGEKAPELKATEAEENELWEQEALESLFYEVSEEELRFFRETRAAARAGKALDGLIKDDKSGDDRSRLLSAAEKGYQATVGYLLLHGADPDHAVDQWTPLHGAAAFGEAGCVALLLLKGAKTEIAGPQGCTPLHMVVRDGWDPGREAIASMLIGTGANINAQDSAGETPLCYAVRTGSGGAVRFFMEHGADPSIKGNEGTPLDIARKMRHEFAARELEAAGAK